MQLSTAAACLDKKKKKIRTRIQNHHTAEVHLHFVVRRLSVRGETIVNFTLNPTNICLCLPWEWVQSAFISRSKITIVYRLHLRSAVMETRHPEHARQDVLSIRLRSSSTWTLLHLRWVWKTNSSNHRNIVSGLHAASCFLFPGALMLSNMTDQEKTERQTRLMVGRSCKNGIRVKSVLKTLRWSFHKGINESEWGSFSKSTSENLTTKCF